MWCESRGQRFLNAECGMGNDVKRNWEGEKMKAESSRLKAKEVGGWKDRR